MKHRVIWKLACAFLLSSQKSEIKFTLANFFKVGTFKVFTLCYILVYQDDYKQVKS